jgi:TetR/AcrR family transcriptional regulator, fatty acid metabolism regulator protein
MTQAETIPRPAGAAPLLRKRDRSRAAILAAARAIFSERGFEQASIIEIAKAAGIAEGTIYKHFLNKRDLLFQVMRAFYEDIIADVEAETMRRSGTAERLTYVVRRQLEVFAHDKGLCRLFIREIRTADDYYDSLVHDLNRRYTAIVVKVIKAGIAAGEVRRDIDPRLVRDLIYGSIEHIAWKTVSGGDAMRIQSTTRALVALVLHGIAR